MIKWYVSAFDWRAREKNQIDTDEFIANGFNLFGNRFSSHSRIWFAIWTFIRLPKYYMLHTRYLLCPFRIFLIHNSSGGRSNNNDIEKLAETSRSASALFAQKERDSFLLMSIHSLCMLLSAPPCLLLAPVPWFLCRCLAELRAHKL